MDESEDQEMECAESEMDKSEDEDMECAESESKAKGEGKAKDEGEDQGEGQDWTANSFSQNEQCSSRPSNSKEVIFLYRITF